ncbi:MAG TPA: CoA transferase [Acidimicrobiales bacterium]|nr:CoA transferase [Acidimicrobiales bacterium]
MSPPLDGIVVVPIEQAVAGPFATRHLADLGARVIKLERVGEGDFARHYDDAVGPGCSSWFAWLNRGKQSVALDVKSEAGRRTLHRLLRHADVFLHNLAPGAADRLGCSAGELRARHPRLVTCAVSGYGPEGPYRDRKAYDLLIQAEAGLSVADIDHEHLAARDRWIDVPSPGGSYPALRSPIDLGGETPAVGSVPALGEHTDEVLAWVEDLERAAS